jgi:hypothetical protein
MLRNIFRFLRFDSTPDPLVAQSIAIQRNAIQREAEKDDTIRALSSRLNAAAVAEEMRAMMTVDRSSEMEEALHMAGAGPWKMPHADRIRAVMKQERATESLGPEQTEMILKENSFPYIAQGAYGDAELMLNNIEWKREVNLSWLEFTRWGIQQVILISRLRCLRDPMLRRGMNVAAQYVFGRGVQITSPDQATNDLLKEWRERNKKVLGQVGLTDQERAKFYDGNLFWACFTDEKNSGEVNIRMIDATEIMDQMTDPDDSATPWYYKRCWTQSRVHPITGAISNERMERWHPALNFEPTKEGQGYFDEIQGVPVDWSAPIYHRKCAVPAKWHFGLPEVYPALSWGDAVKRFLQDCMTIRNALAQFSMILTTKGGQQALQGAKSQLSTTVGPSASLWDQNPPTVAGGIFASGPGSTLAAFNTKGAGGDPDDVRQIKLMVCMTFGLPESFFADMNTSNLATATSLDRPTELNFMERQEVWVEDLTVLGMYQIRKAKGAVNSGYREALKSLRKIRDDAIGKLRVVETPRTKGENGRWIYEAKKQKDDEITIQVDFPAIIEADIPARIGAITASMTLGSKMGEVTGIDEREGVKLLFNELGVDDVEELLDKMYPPKTYDPDRTKEPAEPAPIAPGAPGAPPAEPAAALAEARLQLLNAIGRVGRAMKIWEAKVKEQEAA